LLAPKDIALAIPKNLAEFYPLLDTREFQGLIEELGREHKEYLTLSKSVDLAKYYAECVANGASQMDVDE
jgi:hypothetical protein